MYFGDGSEDALPRHQRSAATEHGPSDVVGYRDEVTGAEHIALVGRLRTSVPLVAVRAECVPGDLLMTTDCDDVRCVR
ncbi:hypothetical protein ACIRSS_05530 [Amycolatopsis sp. NPDC101161]|uniref:hypothetical protein n=1 Tax=Amycolatopsis sp. NPDC101161 TaxID=3363940 RepID=UPI003808B944